jgi:hypothetical protein
MKKDGEHGRPEKRLKEITDKAQERGCHERQEYKKGRMLYGVGSHNDKGTYIMLKVRHDSLPVAPSTLSDKRVYRPEPMREV